MQLQGHATASKRAFVMVNAPVCEDPETGEIVHGYYDPETQTWVGEKRIGAGTYSSRSNGSKGGYSYQSDD